MSFNSIFYSQAFLVKIIPCCLLTTFISLLIKQLVLIKRNNKRLLVTEKKPKTEMLKVSVANTNSRSKAASFASLHRNLSAYDDGINLNANILKQKRCKASRKNENFRATVMLVTLMNRII